MGQRYEAESGIFTRTFAFELVGHTTNDKTCSFGTLKNTIENTINTKIIQQETELVDTNGNKVNLSELVPTWIPSFSKDDIQEYYYRDARGIEPFDEFLVKMFVRKQGLLSRRGRKKYIHIKILDIETNLVRLSESDGGSIIEFRHKLLDASLVFKEKITEKRMKTFPVRLRAYIHLRLNDQEDQVGRVCTLTAVIEPKNRENKSELETFLRYSDVMYVNLDDNIRYLNGGINSGYSNSNAGINVASHHYVLNDKNGKIRLLPLYDFLISLSWSQFVFPIRRNLERLINKKSRQKYLCAERYAKTLHEHEQYISYVSKLIQFSDSSGKYWKDAFLDNKDWLEFLTKFLSYPDHDAPIEFQKEMRDVKENVKGVREEYFFKNRGLGLLDKPTFQQESRSKNILDLNEGGIFWFASWEILLGEMLCSAAGIFILNNKEVEAFYRKHDATWIQNIWKQFMQKTGFRKKTLQAYLDFKRYYDFDLISSKYYSNTYQVAMKSFRVSEYYDTFIQRLKLISDFDIADSDIDNTRTLTRLTWTLVAFTVTIAIGTIIIAHKEIEQIPFLNFFFQPIFKLLQLT